MLLLRILRFGEKSGQMWELRVSLPEALDYEGLFDDLLQEYCLSYELNQVRTIEIGTAYQLIYRVLPRNGQTGKAFLDAARERNGNLPVSLRKVPDTRQTM